MQIHRAHASAEVGGKGFYPYIPGLADRERERGEKVVPQRKTSNGATDSALERAVQKLESQLEKLGRTTQKITTKAQKLESKAEKSLEKPHAAPWRRIFSR